MVTVGDTQKTKVYSENYNIEENVRERGTEREGGREREGDIEEGRVRYMGKRYLWMI